MWSEFVEGWRWFGIDVLADALSLVTVVVGSVTTARLTYTLRREIRFYRRLPTWRDRLRNVALTLRSSGLRPNLERYQRSLETLRIIAGEVRDATGARPTRRAAEDTLQLAATALGAHGGAVAIGLQRAATGGERLLECLASEEGTHHG